MSHAFVTVALPFAAGRFAAVKAALDALGNPAAAGTSAALDETGVVHFMSLSVVPDTADGCAHLMLELNADGCPKKALVAVCNALTPALDQALRAAGLERGREALPAFLWRHHLHIGADWGHDAGVGFCGVPLMSVWRIRNEAKIADKIAKMEVETHGNLLQAPMLASRKLDLVRERLWADNEKWLFAAEPAPFLAGQSAPATVRQALTVALAVTKLAWPLAPVPLLLLWWLGFWPALGLSLAAIAAGTGAAIRHASRLEAAEPMDRSPQPAANKVTRLAPAGGCVQNPLSVVLEVKPGRFRGVLLRLGFGIMRESVVRLFRPGYLGDIGALHFARWAAIPNTNKVMLWLHVSDASEHCVDALIRERAAGLAYIWKNTRGFPPGDAGGPADAPPAEVRQHAVPFWYSAYPQLPLDRIRCHASIRHGIANRLNEKEADAWVACFRL